MPKFGLTDKRPKAWSRRAKSDGSCIPKLRRPRLKLATPMLQWIRFFLVVSTVLWITSGIVLVGWIFASQHKLNQKPGDNISLQSVIDIAHISQWIGCVNIVFMILYGLCLWIASVHFKRSVIAKRFRVCPCCGYDISGRIDDEPCPECGQQISKRELIRIWCKALH